MLPLRWLLRKTNRIVWTRGNYVTGALCFSLVFCGTTVMPLHGHLIYFHKKIFTHLHALTHRNRWRHTHVYLPFYCSTCLFLCTHSKDFITAHCGIHESRLSSLAQPTSATITPTITNHRDFNNKIMRIPFYVYNVSTKLHTHSFTQSQQTLHWQVHCWLTLRQKSRSSRET